MDVCRLFDVLIPEQVYRSAHDLAYTPVLFAGAVCSSLSRRQNSWWKFRRSSPILFCYSGLWSRTSTFQFLVVEGEHVGLQGFPPKTEFYRTVLLFSQERSSERIVEQIVDSRVLGGRFQDFRPVQGSSASSSSSREHPCEGFFRTFPRVKKSPKLGSHSGSELLPESSPSTLSAHQMATDERTSMEDANGHAWVRLDTARGTFWQNLDTGHQQWRPPWDH